jgi:hypothetical protein
MRLIRWFLRGLRWTFKGVTLQDLGFALLAGSGVTMFEVDKLMAASEEPLIAECVSPEYLLSGNDLPWADHLLNALALSGECPVWAGKSRGLSESFLWKQESDLNVRDWMYLV